MKVTLIKNKIIQPNVKVRVGWFAKIDADRNKSNLTNAQVAVANQEARPFWRKWRADNERAYKNAILLILKRGGLVNGEFLQRGLGQLGVQMRNDLQRTILHGNWKPNSPKTIKEKGSSRPLVDTAQMLNSIRGVVEKDGQSTLTF